MSGSIWLEEIRRRVAISDDGICTLRHTSADRVELVLLEIVFSGAEIIRLANDEEAADQYGFAEHLSADSSFRLRGEFLDWKSKEQKMYETPEGEPFSAVEECAFTSSVNDIRCVRLREFYQMNFEVLDND